MGRKKAGTWSPEEKALITGIPKDKNTAKVLQKMATKLNRPYANVYAKWNTENKKTDSSSTKVPLMDFKIVEYDGRSRVSTEEEESMKATLTITVKSLTPSNKRAALFPSRLAPKAKEYLRANYPEHVYSFGKAKEKGFSLLFRRV